MGKLSNIKTRAPSAIILLAFLVGVLYLGGIYLKLTLALISMVAAWEWERIFKGKNFTLMGIFNILTIGVAVFNPFANHYIHWLVLISLYLLNLIIAHKDIKRFALYAFGMLYVSVPMISLGHIYNLYALMGVAFAFAITTASDTGAYLVGCSVGKTKIAPKISPNKSWAGFVGGLVISALVCTLFHDYFVRSSSALALTGLLLSFVSQSGDLFESYVKRFNGRADVKDTSNLIPGHGGVLDRLDSMFFVAPVLVLFLTFL